MTDQHPGPPRLSLTNILFRLVFLVLGLAYLLWGQEQFGLRMALFVTFVMIYAGLAYGTRLRRWL